jgi:hypothetical protein
VKASAALERGAGGVNNAGIGDKKRILYVYESIEGAGAAESHYNRRSTYSAEQLNKIPQANTAVGGVDVDNNVDDIDDGDVAFEPRGDVVAADGIAGRGGADVPRGHNAGQRAVSGGTGARKERGERRRRDAAEDVKIYKIIKRRHRRREDNNIRKYSE